MVYIIPPFGAYVYPTILNMTDWWISNPCPGHTTGKAGLLFRNLVNMLLASACALGNPCLLYPDDYGPYLVTEGCESVFDFIVVGGGTAGAAVAGRLSEVANWKVLLLEAGGDPPMTVEVPAFWPSLLGTHLDWMFRAIPEKGMYTGMADRSNLWSMGRCLGGTSSIGRMIWNKGNPDDYDNWHSLGNPGWSYKEVLYYFKKAEHLRDLAMIKCDLINGAYTGSNGMVSIEQFNYRSKLIKDLEDAYEEVALRDIHDPDLMERTGYYRAHGSLKNGERINTAKAYLPRFRDNLFVVKFATVTKILICSDTKRAYGVQFKLRSDCQPRCAKARREVVLCAGVINSPKLLLLSGVGPRNHLNELGIPCLADVPGVGCNLQTHAIFYGGVIALNKTKTLHNPWRLMDNAYEYLTRRSGPLSTIFESELFSQVGNLNTQADIPLIQLHNIFIAKNRTDHLTRLGLSLPLTAESYELYERLIKDTDLLIIAPVLQKPMSRGTVTLRCKDPDSKPTINPNLLGDPMDVEYMLNSMRLVSMLADTKALRRHDADLKRLDFPGCCEEDLETDSYWACVLSYVTGTFGDAVGTNKMGPACDPMAVVSPELRVRGVKGLRVIDASVMPRVPGANTMAPTIMVAEKGSAQIKKDWLKVYKPASAPKNS